MNGQSSNSSSNPFPDSNSLPIGDEAFDLASLSKQAEEDKQQIFNALILPSSELHPAVLASSLQFFAQEICDSPPPRGPGGYIWNRESPIVSLTSQNFVSVSFRVSDSVEDEWFATYILIKATIRFKGIAISISDQDGQFLLIEAADFLPSWITPDNSKNRLWIFNGELHLIPPSIVPLTVDDLNEEEAVSIIRDSSKSTLAPKEVEQAAFSRIKDYPISASDNSQRTLVFLPNKVAKVLLSDPQIIAPVSESICTRDAISSRAFQRMINFPPLEDSKSSSTTTTSTSDSQSQPQSHSTRSIQNEDLPTLVSIRLTRRIYAQLMAQRFYPPKVFGRKWQSAVENYRALIDSTTSEDDDDLLSPKEREERKRFREEGKWWDLGCKISCGLEMLYSQEKALESRKPRSVRPNESRDPRDSSSYDSFLSSLSTMGYFGSEIQGSARWKQLELEAVEKWQALTSAQSKTEEEIEKQSAHAGISKRIDAILSTSNDSDLPSIDPSQPLSKLNQFQDSDDWLTLSSEDLEEMLSSSKTGNDQNNGNSEEDLEKQTAEQLKSFASKMEDFINAQGDLEGARFSDEGSDDDDDLEEIFESKEDHTDLGLEDDDDDEMDLDDETEERKKEKEKEALKKAQKKLADLSTDEREVATSKLISSLNQEEWGAKNSDSAKRAADMAKKMAYESSKESNSNFNSSNQDQNGMMEVDPTSTSQQEMEVDSKSKELSDQANVSTSSATLSGLGGPQHFDGDSDEEESFDADDDTAEEKADRAAWLGLDDPNSKPSTKENPSLASSSQGFIRIEIEPEVGEEEEEEVEDSMQTEMNGFLEFSRRALGLSDEHYAKILSERSARGAYVPTASQNAKTKTSSDSSSSNNFQLKSNPLNSQNLDNSLPNSKQELKSSQNSISTIPSSSNKFKNPLIPKLIPTTSLNEREKAKEKADQTLVEAEESAKKRKEERRNLQQNQIPNPNISSFEQLMIAMEKELGSEKKSRENGINQKQIDNDFSKTFNTTNSSINPSRTQTTSQKPSIPKTTRFSNIEEDHDSMLIDPEDSDSDEDEELSAQDTELLKNLLSSNSKGSLASLSNLNGGADEKGNPNEDQINLISNFLESFKAQGGEAGPVGNLANRMGVKLPRDDGK